MAVDADEVRREGQPSIPGLGLLKGLTVTLKTMLRPAVTQRYPDVKPDLPARTRGVIALKEANCTVCYKCARECPDWCIYIDAHKETHEPAGGGKGRSAKVLDRFAIDYALCMYCGICVEVCPFDALFWSPEFEYAEYEVDELIHEKEKLEEWTYKVLPPPPLEDGAEPPAESSGSQSAGVPGVETAPPGAAAATVAATSVPGVRSVSPPETPAPAAPPAAAPAEAVAVSTPEAPALKAQPAPSTEHKEVSLDQETFDRVLAELLDKGTDRRVAEGQARRAAMIAARKKAEEG